MIISLSSAKGQATRVTLLGVDQRDAQAQHRRQIRQLVLRLGGVLLKHHHPEQAQGVVGGGNLPDWTFPAVQMMVTSVAPSEWK